MNIKLLFLLFVGTAIGHVFAAEVKPPNIVLIVADDLGYADVLFNPQHPPEIRTPHLDALAKESVICRQGYVSGHVCSPTRAGLMTGRYQQRMGLYTGGEAGSGLPMSEMIFPQFLSPAGYVSCQLGKWHLGPTPQWSPALRGFDEVFGFLGRGAHDYFKLNDPSDPIYRGTQPVQESGYLTDRLGEEAVSFIQRHDADPFFLYLAFNAVHAPLQAPADEVAKFDTGNPDRNTLLAMGKRMDDAIGNIVATLKQESIWDNTLLFFISDNGGPLAQTANNTPLRGGKHQDYEGGVRVPFLVCWPGKLTPGESQAVVSSLDILPTALAAAGIASPEKSSFDGINILPILRGETTPTPRDLFWCAGAEEGWWAVRSGDWKVVGDKQRVGLFDLSQDVSEKQDLAQQMPEKLAELTALHDSWLEEMAYPMKGGAKRYGMPAPLDQKTKGTKKPKKRKASSDASVSADGEVRDAFVALPAKPQKAASSRPPNVLFLAVDDMNDWIGCLETTPHAITPNIDALAARGVNFTNAHTAGVFCAPSRAAIFSGQYASTTGCYTSPNYFVHHPEIESLQTSFAKAGYTTLGTGKLYHHPAGAIDQRGWAEFFLRNQFQREGGWALESWSSDTPVPQPFPASIYNRGKQITGGLFLEWGPIPNEREEEMADTIRINWAVEQLKQKHDKPFFLACGIYAPHFPNYCPQKYFDMYDPDQIPLPPMKDDDLEDLPPKVRRQKENRRRAHHDKLVEIDAVDDAIHGYLACMSYADAMMGRVLDALESSPYADNTIVVFWSDHGYHHGEKGDWGKHTLWERTSNVPFIWAGPGVTQGQKSDVTVSLIDMYPTLVEICELPRPSQTLEGESLAKILIDPAMATDRNVFLPYMTPGEFAIINRDWRYIRYGEDGEELYNVREDPNEWNNLASDPQYTDIMAELSRSAPQSFAAPEPKLNERKDLVVEGETFRWQQGKGNYVPHPKYLPYNAADASPTEQK